MRLFRTILCAAILGASAGAAQPADLNDEALKTLGTAELARRILPPEVASTVVEHQIFDRGYPLSTAVEFFGPAASHPDGTCRRMRYQVFLGHGQSPMLVEPKVQVALSPDCKLPPGAFFAHIQPKREFEGAVAALLRLKEAATSASAADPLPFELTCRTTIGPEECGAGARAVLTRLPLDRVYIVEPGYGGGWEVAVMPTGPGEIFWNVTMIDSSTKVPARIDLSREIPAPF